MNSTVAPQYSHPVLSTLSDSIALYSTLPLYPGYIAVYPLVHALRTACAYQGIQRSSGARGNVGYLQGLFGYLVSSWGGVTLVSILLGTPVPWAFNAPYFLTYVSVYSLSLVPALSSLLALLPPEPLAILDGLYRTSGSLSILHLLTTHAFPQVRSSPFAALLLGALNSAGGGLLVGTFGLAEPEWTLRTPAVFSAGVWGTLDWWAGAVVVAVYGLLSSVHEGLGPEALLGTAGVGGEKIEPGPPLLSQGEAKTIAIAVGTALFLTRALRTSGAAPAKPAAPSSAAVVVEEKEVTSVDVDAAAPGSSAAGVRRRG